MSNEKLKENIVRAACDAVYWESAWDKLANPGLGKRIDSWHKNNAQEIQEASQSLREVRIQLRKLTAKLKALDSDYE